MVTQRDSAAVARRTHNPEVVSSSLTPAMTFHDSVGPVHVVCVMVDGILRVRPARLVEFYTQAYGNAQG